MPNEIITQRHPEDVIEALLILLSPKREEEYIDETNEDDGGVGGDDVGGGEVVGVDWHVVLWIYWLAVHIVDFGVGVGG